MEPAVPPLPTPWNLPFQVWSGSQTSNRIAGLVVAVTRQNAGRLPMGWWKCGGVKLSDETIEAEAIVVLGSWRLTRFLHDWGLASAKTGAARRSRTSMGKIANATGVREMETGS